MVTINYDGKIFFLRRKRRIQKKKNPKVNELNDLSFFDDIFLVEKL